MQPDPTRDTAATDGTTDMAECADCEPRLPMPFKNGDDRDEWANAHAEATGHRVWRFVEPPYDL